MLDDLPADDEYLQELYDELGDHRWGEILGAPLREPEVIDSMLQSGPFTENDRPMLERTSAQLSDPSAAFQGEFIATLKNYALTLLGPLAADVAHIPVGLLPTRELNACAVPTPRGGHVILMDSGVLFTAQMLAMCHLAIDSWHSSEPFSREFSQLEYAQTLLGVADYCATGDLRSVRRTPGWRASVLLKFDQSIFTVSLMMELFILLHEYGHVILGHLDCKATTVLAAIPHVKAFYKSPIQEYEADEFALKQFAAMDPAFARDVLIGPGLLFGLTRLVEGINRSRGRVDPGTHPPALERWRRLVAQAALDQYPHSANTRIESLYSGLMEAARLT